MKPIKNKNVKIKENLTYNSIQKLFDKYKQAMDYLEDK